MLDPLTVCSTFSGVGGMDLGLERAGMRVVMSCEFVPWRRRILQQHWPDVPCCPDIRLLGEQSSVPSIDDDPESPTYGQRFYRDGSYHPGRIDMLCGGFPCQDVSVAGQRRGLAGRRTGLFFEFARAADELVRPGGLILLENVPGLLSSHGGRDFAVILATLAELGFHDVAWRVLDSRHFGVPQRRRRVFILGRRARGRFCASVLLELDGGVGDPAAGREAWAAATDASRPSVAGARGGRAGGTHDAPAVASTLTRGSGEHKPGRRGEDDRNLVSPAVTAKWRTGSGGPAGDECQNLVDDRTVSERIDDGELAQGLTTTAFNGWDAKQAEANWVVPVGQGPNANDPDVAGTLGAFGKTGGHKQDLDAAGAYVIDPREPTAGPVLTGSGGGRTTDLDGVGYAVRAPEPGAGSGHPDDARRGDGDAASEHGGRPVGQDADGVREAARREHRGRPRDVGGRRHGEEPELDGAGRDERGARDEPGAARLRARDERGARALDAPADGEGDGDGAAADADGVRAAAGLPRRMVDPAPVSCIHPDAVGYDGICKTDSIDAAGVSRKRDAGLGVINDGTSYSLKTGAPPVIGPVDAPEPRAAVESGQGWWTESEEAATLRVDGDPATVVNEQPEAFLPRHYTRGKDGAPSGTVPALTSEMDRGDGHAMVHQPGVGFTSTLGSLDSDGIEIDGCPPIMARTPPAAAMPTMFDASSTHGHEGVGTGRPNMAAPGESLALTSRADRYAMFGLDRHGPGEDADCFPTCPFDPTPDGPRYAAMGDAVTVPVLHWIGAKIVAEAEAHGGLHNVPSDQGAV